jgi:glycosyltransferase involved in cell wall biosynthesis
LNDPPAISVLIPTYGFARFLPQAIESVLSQSFRDIEVIVSDDASADGSAEVVRRYAATDPRIRPHVHGRNVGMVANWNWCLAQAQGRYVKYVFGDDFLAHPDALRRLWELMEGNSAAALAASARAVVDETGRPMEIWKGPGPLGRTSAEDVLARCLRDERNHIGEPSAVMFRRADALRGFDPTFRQLVDLEMWFHLLRHGALARTDEPLCAFRRHPAQQTEANARTRIASVEMLRIAARYPDVLETAFRPSTRPRRLFDLIYYARKAGLDTAEAKAAERALMDKLGAGGYRRQLLRHRLTKPFKNLRRKMRKGISL